VLMEKRVSRNDSLCLWKNQSLGTTYCAYGNTSFWERRIVLMEKRVSRNDLLCLWEYEFLGTTNCAYGKTSL